jgi:glycosyltransferase involved in cell wall biosynthesis
MNRKPLVSVIIPVYNTEKYIRQCVDSVINQTYKNLEIILVDDGSTDNSTQICDCYAARDERVSVIHKENGGVASARNAGIKRINGDYFTFVDSDDYLLSAFTEKLLSVLLNSGSDIACCNFVYDKNSKTITSYKQNCILSGEETVNDYLYRKKEIGSCCGKLYRTSKLAKQQIGPFFVTRRSILRFGMPFFCRLSFVYNR